MWKLKIKCLHDRTFGSVDHFFVASTCQEYCSLLCQTKPTIIIDVHISAFHIMGRRCSDTKLRKRGVDMEGTRGKFDATVFADQRILVPTSWEKLFLRLSSKRISKCWSERVNGLF